METNPVRAAALYESVLKEKPVETSALVNLGAICTDILFTNGAVIPSLKKTNPEY